MQTSPIAKYLFLFYLLIIITACAKKSLPVITERKSAAPDLNSAIVSTITPDIETGKKIFTNRCGRCHGLPDPVVYDQKNWETILTLMAPKARLNSDERAHISAYLKANAKN